MNFFTKRLEQTTEDKLLLIKVQADELGYSLIETDKFITAPTYFKELDTMLKEKIQEVGEFNRDMIMKYELTLIFSLLIKIDNK